MPGSFNTKEFKLKIRKLFENDSLEGLEDEELPVSTPEVDEIAGLEGDLDDVAKTGEMLDNGEYDKLGDAAKKVDAAVSGIETVEKLAQDGVVSPEDHQKAEADLSAELDAAVDELIAAQNEFKEKEAVEGNPDMSTETPVVADEPAEGDDVEAAPIPDVIDAEGAEKPEEDGSEGETEEEPEEEKK